MVNSTTVLVDFPEGPNSFSRIAKRIGKKYLTIALKLYFVYKDGDLSIGRKTVVTEALGYLLLTKTILPDRLPFVEISFMKITLTSAYDIVKNAITPKIEAKAKRMANNLLPD